MTMDTPAIIRLTKERLEPAAAMLSEAFRDYPVTAFFFPDAAGRERLSLCAYQSMLRYCLRYGEVYASPELEGVAAWLPSEKMERTPWRSLMTFAPADLPLVFKAGPEMMSQGRTFQDYTMAVHRRHAPLPHMYLQLLGVAAVHRGKGYAGALVRHMFPRLDERRLPCFVETQMEENVDIYRHLGFRVVEEGKIPGTEMTSWAMMRMPE